MLTSLNANGLVNRDVGSISPVVRRLTVRLWEPELAKRTALKGVIEWAPFGGMLPCGTKVSKVFLYIEKCNYYGIVTDM